MSKEQKRDELTEIIIKANEDWLKEFGRMHLHLEHKAEYIAAEVVNAGYRKQSEGEINYKALYEQLLEDFEHALHYAEKNNNVCNFCEHDCGEGGVCKGRDDFIYCAPKWRGMVEFSPDEAPKGGAE